MAAAEDGRAPTEEVACIFFKGFCPAIAQMEKG
jgi:hypothetical protein